LIFQEPFGIFPHSHRTERSTVARPTLASYQGDFGFPPGFNHIGIITLRCERSFLGAGDLAHGIVEGQAEDLDMEVNGIASEVAFGPAPIGVFYDESGIGGQNKVARLAFDELESAQLQERNQRGQPGGADLFARPAWISRRWAGHSLFSSGVG